MLGMQEVAVSNIKDEAKPKLYIYYRAALMEIERTLPCGKSKEMAVKYLKESMKFSVNSIKEIYRK